MPPRSSTRLASCWSDWPDRPVGDDRVARRDRAQPARRHRRSRRASAAWLIDEVALRTCATFSRDPPPEACRPPSGAGDACMTKRYKRFRSTSRRSAANPSDMSVGTGPRHRPVVAGRADAGACAGPSCVWIDHHAAPSMSVLVESDEGLAGAVRVEALASNPSLSDAANVPSMIAERKQSQRGRLRSDPALVRILRADDHSVPFSFSPRSTVGRLNIPGAGCGRDSSLHAGWNRRPRADCRRALLPARRTGP